MESQRKKKIVILLIIVTFLLGLLSVGISYYIQQSQSPNDSGADAQCSGYNPAKKGVQCLCTTDNGKTILDEGVMYSCTASYDATSNITTATWTAVGCDIDGSGVLVGHIRDSTCGSGSCAPNQREVKTCNLLEGVANVSTTCNNDSTCLQTCEAGLSCSGRPFNGATINCITTANEVAYCCPSGYLNKDGTCIQPSVQQNGCKVGDTFLNLGESIKQKCGGNCQQGFYETVTCTSDGNPTSVCVKDSSCPLEVATTTGGCSVSSASSCYNLNVGNSCVVSSVKGTCTDASTGSGTDSKIKCFCKTESVTSPIQESQTYLPSSDGQKTSITTYSQTCNDADGCTCPSGSASTSVTSGNVCTQSSSLPVVGGSCGSGGSCFLQGGVYSGVTVTNCGSVGRIDSTQNNCSAGYLCCKTNSYIAQCTWNSNSPAGCTGDGVNRQYVNGTPTRAACCSGLTEDGYGTCGCTQAVTLALSCTNGATNYPDCNACPAGQSYIGGNCQSVCTNGATNYPACNTCVAGYTLVNGTCSAPCLNGATNTPSCTTCPSNFTMVNNQCVANCTNGATNPSACNECPAGKTLIGGSCIVPTTVPGGIGGGALPSTGLFDSNYNKMILGIIFMLLGVIFYKYNVYSNSLELLAGLEKQYSVYKKGKKSSSKKSINSKFENAVEKRFDDFS